MIRKVFLILVLLASTNATAAEIEFPSSSGNVSFNDILALASNSASSSYAYGSDNPQLQYAELWLPGNATIVQKAPVVVFIHGGCWLNSFNIAYTHPFSTALSQAGYAVWSLEYRRTGDEGGGWPGTYEDIKAGLEFLDSLQNQPIDTSNIVISGHSAGGHLALLTGTEYPQLNGVIGLAAIADIVSYSQGSNSCQTVTADFMGGDYDSMPDAYSTANPAGKTLHEDTVLLQGDIDSIVPVEQSRLRGANTIIQDGAGHFDWVHPGTPAFARFLESLEQAFAQ
jgi:acetyl esterase/lipase